jgi:hypothetical protein
MKKLMLVFPLVAFLFGGCLTDEIFEPKVTGNPVEVFRDGKLPRKSYTVIRTLTDDGHAGEQADIEEKFIREARRRSADALILYPKERSGEAFTGVGVADTYLFKGEAITYK